jgi:hypothetical protein
MAAAWWIAAALVAALVVALGWGAWGARRDTALAGAVWDDLARTAPVDPARYDPAMLAGLPAVAQRYFANAIAPGTLLHRSVQMRIEGSFILNGRALPMRCDQVSAPGGFVWRAHVGTGALRFSGSDGLAPDGRSWTRFRLWGLFPLVRAGGTEDHRRAAAARLATERIWTPASLLPQAGAVWTELTPDNAEVAFPEIAGVEPIHLTLDATGRVLAVETRRWTDANPDQVYRFQPFGGTMLAQAQHQGFTVPTAVEIGNFYGTPDFAPFFHATLVELDYFD